MSIIDELHEQAMDLAEEAFSFQRRGNAALAVSLFLQALTLEKQAASVFPANQDSEPSRSILYRSAAALAYHAQDYEQAEQLIACGLSGYPPIEIKNELRALHDDVTFRQHVGAKGIELAENQMDMTLWGNATGYGMIYVDLLLKRVDQIKTIFYRTTERLLKVPYRVTGKPYKWIIEAYSLYLNAFFPSSFGISFSIGQPFEQLLLPLSDFPVEKVSSTAIIDEVITCFDLLQNNELDILQKRIKNEDYYQNFVGMVRQVAPDGNAIKVLGLTSKNSEVALRRTREQIPSPRHLLEGESENESRNFITLEGILKVANSLDNDGKNGIVKLFDVNQKKSFSIRVPLNQMQDVVQPYFEEYVVIIAYKRGNKIYFEDIKNDGNLISLNGIKGKSMPERRLFD